MKKRMLILGTLICLLSACLPKTASEQTLNAMRKPVFIVAIGSNGSVLLRDSTGGVLQLPASYYMAQSICDSGLKNGDVLIPATTIR